MEMLKNKKDTSNCVVLKALAYLREDEYFPSALCSVECPKQLDRDHVFFGKVNAILVKYGKKYSLLCISEIENQNMPWIEKGNT